MTMASRRAQALRLLTTSSRGISSTPHLASRGWFDRIKAALTDKLKTRLTGVDDTFSITKYADSMAAGARKEPSGRAAAATARHAAVLRYLATVDPTGENLTSSHKISATEHCNCTIADVEHAVAKYMWMKEAHAKMVKLKEDNQIIPSKPSEVHTVMDKTPLDVLRSNLAKSGEISRNALCPCGSKKRYKRCCGAS